MTVRNRLGVLQMCIARHNRFDVFFGHLDQRFLQSRDFINDFWQTVFQIQMKVSGDLVIS